MVPCKLCGRPTVQIHDIRKCLCCGMDQAEEIIPAGRKVKCWLTENECIDRDAHLALANNVDGSLDYLKRRGVTDATIKRWGLGYITKGYQGFKTEAMINLWEKRVSFPIISKNNEGIIGFGGRIIEAVDRPKYVNSPQSANYNKREELYGYNLVPEQAPIIYLCEGYMDCVSMDSHGYYYPVASLGTALTKEQAYLIRKKTTKVAICYDTDDAGEKATVRAIKMLWQAGFLSNDIQVFKPRDAKDVDEALQKGSAIRRTSANLYLLEHENFEELADSLALHTTGGKK